MSDSLIYIPHKQPTKYNPDGGSLDGIHYTCSLCQYQNPVPKVDGKYIAGEDIVCYACGTSSRQRREEREKKRKKWLDSLPKKEHKEYHPSKADLRRCREIITAVLKAGDDEIRAWWDFVQLRGKMDPEDASRKQDTIGLFGWNSPSYQTILNAMRAGKHMGWLETRWIGLCGAETPWAGAPNKTMNYIITEKGKTEGRSDQK